MRKIAIVYLSDYTSWPMGGMLTYVKNLIPFFIMGQKKWEADVWGSTIDGKSSGEININGNTVQLRTYTNVKTQKKIVPNFLRSFFDIIIKRHQFDQYDILYSHTSATTIGLKICHPGKFVVHHQHGLSYKDNRGVIKIFNLGYTIAQLLADATFFVASNDEVENHKHSIPLLKHKKMYAIGSPIEYKTILETSAYEWQHSDTVRFVYTGRIDKWKNIDLLIDSFKIFTPRNANLKAQLTLIGDGPLFDEVQAKIINDGIEERVNMTGALEREQIIKNLGNSDFFLFPSKGEGVSLSMLEALAAGLPIVGFDVMGVRNLIVDQKTGILVKEQNADEFVKGMEAVITCETISKEFCRDFAKSYDSDEIARQIVDIILADYNAVKWKNTSEA